MIISGPKSLVYQNMGSFKVGVRRVGGQLAYESMSKCHRAINIKRYKLRLKGQN